MQIIKREELPEQRQVRLTIAVDKDTWQASLAKCYQGVKSVCPVAGDQAILQDPSPRLVGRVSAGLSGDVFYHRALYYR